MNILDFDPVFVLTITIAIAVSIAIMSSFMNIADLDSAFFLIIAFFTVSSFVNLVDIDIDKYIAFILAIAIAIAFAFAFAFAFVKRVSPGIVSPGIVSPEQFKKLVNSHKCLFLIGSAKAGIDDASFPAIEKIVENMKHQGFTHVVNNGDGPYAGYKSIVDVTTRFSAAGFTVLTAQSDAGKAEPGTNWWPMHTLFACFLPTVKNSDGTTTWCALSDKGKMCAPLAFLIKIISWMWRKPIVLCIGGGLGSMVEEKIYRLAGCLTFILKTRNVTSPTDSLVEPTENYHVKCLDTTMNGNLYHPRGKCPFGLKCCKFS